MDFYDIGRFLIMGAFIATVFLVMTGLESTGWLGSW